jgi:hypothetical protein
MGKNELILHLVDSGMTTSEAEKCVMTELQFIQQIEREFTQQVQDKQKIIRLTNFMYNKWLSQSESESEPADFTYEEAVKWLSHKNHWSDEK